MSSHLLSCLTQKMCLAGSHRRTSYFLPQFRHAQKIQLEIPFDGNDLQVDICSGKDLPRVLHLEKWRGCYWQLRIIKIEKDRQWIH